MDRPGWQKALVLAGGAVATGGLLWYLLREGTDEEEEEEAKAEGTTVLGDGQELLFKVTDPKCCSIGIREEPDVFSRKTGRAIFPGEVFKVSQVVAAEGGQRYLLLSDGRGWAFTHSSRDGRLLAQEISPEEAMGSQSGMEAMMQEAGRLLESNPALREQVLNSPEVQRMMANPENLSSVAGQSTLVSQALDQRPELREALASDPAALASALSGAGAGQAP